MGYGICVFQIKILNADFRNPGYSTEKGSTNIAQDLPVGGGKKYLTILKICKENLQIF
jgi:hypothetical protein